MPAPSVHLALPIAVAAVRAATVNRLVERKLRLPDFFLARVRRFLRLPR